jgi:hypothetical protein
MEPSIAKFALLFYLLIRVVSSLGQSPTITFSSSPGTIFLGDGSASVRILQDPFDWSGVQRAAANLVIDFGKVTGRNATLNLSRDLDRDLVRLNSSTPPLLAQRQNVPIGGTIVVGTIGKNAIVDALIKAGKLDVSGVINEWESYVSQVVVDPSLGNQPALVIAGSDKRGTIYGIYNIAEQIGVSPWYFWADVPAKQHLSIYAIETRAVRGPPSVKYRGIFINNEAPALTKWVNSRFNKSQHGSAFVSGFYQPVFELLLRLKANTLWPAMWDSMFNVDDPENQRLADDFGIVMGTSHTEPFMRSTKEWSTFGNGNWSWQINKEKIIPFLREGARRAKQYENIFTVGMRGYHDTPLSETIETTLLQDIVTTQRQILKEENMADVEQVWCLYKEVQGYYEAGLKVPDDVTLLWSDDNWGNIRRLPTDSEQSRKGGAGVYYHFDYVGEPRSYKWVSTLYDFGRHCSYSTDQHRFSAKDMAANEHGLRKKCKQNMDRQCWRPQRLGEWHWIRTPRGRQLNSPGTPHESFSRSCLQYLQLVRRS